MYVGYEYYKETYNGTVPMERFNNLEIRASNLIDYYTFNRLKDKEIGNKAKFAVCELIDYLAELKATGGKEVASETVGTHSITYVTAKDGRDPIKAKQKSIVAKYLAHTGLMYRGVR